MIRPVFGENAGWVHQTHYHAQVYLFCITIGLTSHELKVSTSRINLFGRRDYHVPMKNFAMSVGRNMY